jgi:phospholipase C
MIRNVSALSKTSALLSMATIILTGCGNTGNITTPGTVITPPAAPTPPTPVAVAPSTAIKHVVVIFGENISFDHYFGTYPRAANIDGTPFTAATGTPTNINNYISNPTLLTGNPNLAAGNGNSAANPFRLSPDQAGTGDQDHNYGPEQAAFDSGKMDLFPFSVGTADGATLTTETAAPALANTTALTMAYYDGNTVTGLWNYAQHYAMNDHSFGTTFGASTQGAINLVSGQTNGAVVTLPGAASGTVNDGAGGLTLIGDEDPANDVCSSSSATVQMTGKNIGDLLNAASTPVTWGFFEGGFDLTKTNSNFTNASGVPVIASGTGCLVNEATGSRATGAVYIPQHPLKADYIPHHQPFQYYASTANPMHNRPTGAIGATDAANHQYDTADFNAALTAATPSMPAVSFLKAPGYQDGHAGYSDPLDEQNFVVSEINAIEASPFWNTTAIIIAYDDSDGWYDHVSNFLNGSQTTADVANGFCSSAPTLTGVTATTPVQGRCGYGPRLPLLVISPWAKANFVDNTVTDQSSVTRFIEDIFLGSQRIGGGSSDTVAGSIMSMFNFSTLSGALPNPTPVFLSPTTGAVCSSATCK